MKQKWWREFSEFEQPRQRSIDVILQGIDNVVAIQDGILVTGRDDDDHLRNLGATLLRLKEYGVRLKLEKCKFMQESMVYMGSIISASGIQPTDEKVEAVKNAPQPKDASQLKSFLGMVNYHGKFIKNLSTVLHPCYRKDVCSSGYLSVKDHFS